ncbi:actin-like protein Arp6 [Sistotremastrum niveocremeum HHB9708]|uniref:Actin-like protein ARP6 n=1 Tax=Sistotremastrum niveocremeum HHB9708 TaxID=1314777 RepID=A0A164YZ26_9AGAM|nr:actin-like protein Arp6 [Sistotremastrum niveocremeum HHB9708]
MSSPVLILDNGGHTIKCGWSTSSVDDVQVIPNAVVRSKSEKRQYIGHEFSSCTDYSSLNWRLPVEKGFIADWDAQKAVWDGIFDKVLNVEPSQTSLLITEPPFNLPNIQEQYDQLIFEEYEFESYYRAPAAFFAPYKDLFAEPNSSSPPPECTLIVDSGFSFTHVIPIMEGSIFWPGVRRIDVGGKLLTNHLANLVSYRQWNMLDQTHIINDVKESCCYVGNTAARFGLDLELCRAKPKRNPIIQEYLLPDYSRNRPGRLHNPQDIITDSDQILYMENERFSVPEVLFRPSDIGMDQAGLAETIAASISTLPIDLQGMFWANIGLIGGNTRIPSFEERLLSDLRPLAPVDAEISLYKDENPILTAYGSAHEFVSQDNFAQVCVTLEEYNEGGSNAVRRKIRDWKDVGVAPTLPSRRQNTKEKEKTEQERNTPSRGTPVGKGTARRQSAVGVGASSKQKTASKPQAVRALRGK